MQLRPHQQVMLDAMESNRKGYLTCGTGGGKTLTFITDSRRFLIPGNVIAVVAPQLLLSEQLFSEFDFHLSDIDFVYRQVSSCLLYTSPSPRDATLSRMPSSA